MAKCPVCEKASAGRAVNPAYPFCSERCRLLDLGKWLGGTYRIPAQPADAEDDELPSLAQSGPAQPDDEQGDA